MSRDIRILHAPLRHRGIVGLTAGAASTAVAGWIGGSSAVTSVIGATAGQIVGNAVGAAAGDALAQGIGLATGAQKQFSFSQLAGSAAVGALAGPLSNGLGRAFGASYSSSGIPSLLTNVTGTVLAGVGGNALSQEINILTGQQNGWDWSQTGLTAGFSGLGAIAGHYAELYQKTCFAAGTRLLTPDGDKPIEEFQVGDVLLSRDENNPEGPVVPKAVEEVFARSGPIMKLYVGGRLIQTTAEHPFYVRGKGWLKAAELKADDLLLSHDRQWTPVERLLSSADLQTVYNLRIADYHTYFVGCAEWGFSVWAHNAYEVPKDVRDSAVAAAWQQEADLVRRTGQGTRPWTDKPVQQLLDNGKVSGYVGHHINSVNDSPLFAGMPDNIQFVTFRQHYRLHNDGRYAVPVYGNMLSRE